MFPAIKSQLKEQRFAFLQELRTETLRITQQYDREWYRDICRQWVYRHHRCIDHGGEYFEKQYCYNDAR